MKDISLEVDAIKKISQKSLNELRGLSNFFKIFTKVYQEEVIVLECKLNDHINKYKNIDDSILSANIIGIYDNCHQYNQNIQSLMTKISNELIKEILS